MYSYELSQVICNSRFTVKKKGKKKKKIKFKMSILKSSLCDYSDVCILVSRPMTVPEVAAGGENNNIQAAFKN